MITEIWKKTFKSERLYHYRYTARFYKSKRCKYADRLNFDSENSVKRISVKI